MTSILKRIMGKFQSYYFNARLSLHGFLNIPVQTGKERQIFKAIFNQTDREKVLKIFEWGSGFSTVYYGKYLSKLGVKFEWHSIDNNREWHEKVQILIKEKKLDSNIKLYLKEFLPFWEKPGWNMVPPPCAVYSPKSEEELGYINLPKQFDDKFNIIIVDARFRKHCIQTAKEVLLPEGIVVLHDAQKPHYHEGLDAFPHRKFIDSGVWYPLQEVSNQMWIGCLKNNPIYDGLKLF